jgi:hypothetical protein
MASNANEEKERMEIADATSLIMSGTNKVRSGSSDVYKHYGVNDTNEYQKLLEMARYYDVKGVIQDPLEKSRIQMVLKKGMNSLVKKTKNYKKNKNAVTSNAKIGSQKLKTKMGHLYKNIMNSHTRVDEIIKIIKEINTGMDNTKIKKPNGDMIKPLEIIKDMSTDFLITSKDKPNAKNFIKMYGYFERATEKITKNNLTNAVINKLLEDITHLKQSIRDDLYIPIYMRGFISSYRQIIEDDAGVKEINKEKDIEKIKKIYDELYIHIKDIRADIIKKTESRDSKYISSKWIYTFLNRILDTLSTNISKMSNASNNNTDLTHIIRNYNITQKNLVKPKSPGSSGSPGKSKSPRSRGSPKSPGSPRSRGSPKNSGRNRSSAVVVGL